MHSADAGLENETEENMSFDLDNLSYQAGRGHAVAFRGVSLIDHYLVVSENGVYPANSHYIAIFMGNMMENRWIFGCTPFSDKPIYLILSYFK